ncbi:MAG: CHASE domain-containing protein [Melioribacteraceae bacterium]|nr:CHASE domain-containing protein [Melioribacteraceae bacterium]
MGTVKINRKIKQANRGTALLLKVWTRNRFILPFLVLLTSLVISYINWNVANRNAENELRSYFEYRARDVYNRIEQRIISYEQILRGACGLFNASANVNRSEFRSFFNTLNLDISYPGIQGVGFSLIVSPEQIRKHILTIRAEGFPEYKIRPEGFREIYTSIIYLEPFRDRNLRAFGYDMFSEPVRRKAMETARDSNKTVISGKVNLVQETGKEVQAGFLIYLPVYKNGTQYTTVSERRSNIIGWVYSPFRMNDFMDGLFGELAADLDVKIYDSKNISNETKLYDSKTETSRSGQPLTIKKEVDFNNHLWTVIVKSTPELETRIGFNTATIILIVGLSISLLLTIITWLLENKRRQTIITNTERKLAENSLKKLQEEQQILLDHIPAWVFYKDTENRFIHVNKAFADAMGMSIEQLNGKSLFDIFPKEQAEAFWKDDKEVLSSGKPKVNIIEPAESLKGTIWVQTDKIPFRNIEGKIVGLIGFAIDITELKHVENSLRESHQIIEGIINTIPVRVFWKDKNLVYLGCNKLFALDAGFTDPKEIIGKDDFQMGWHNQAELYREDDRMVMKSGNPKLLIEESQTTPMGNNITLLTSKIPLLNPAEEIIGVLGTYIDISERKHVEDKLKKSHEQLIKLNAEKDKFFSIIAHDLKSPFNGFLGLTELMADKTENFTLDEVTEQSKSLNKAAKNLYKLLENLLEWAQVQNGSINFTPQNSDLSKMVSQSIDTISQRALLKGITIVNEVGNSQKVYADEKMIGTVLRNLLSNAVKFTRKNGKVIISPKRLENGTIEVSVTDNGVGIPEKDVKRLFRVEEKVSTKGTDGELSTGLGLLLCKEFIEMHRGKIWAESKENTGSTFYFTLPLK